MSRTRKLLVTLASVALAASVASPAAADSAKFKDKRDDLRGGFDVHSVSVKNNGPAIKVRSKHRNLKYGPGASGGGISVYLDVFPRRKGPEFIINGGVGFDSEYYLAKVKRWNTGSSLGCRGLKFHPNYKKETLRVVVKRRCLDRAYDRRIGKVRVAVRAAQNRSSGQPMIDWAPRWRHFYRAVARG